MSSEKKRARSSSAAIEKVQKKHLPESVKYANPRNDKAAPEKRTYTAFSWMNTAKHPLTFVGRGGLDQQVHDAGQREASFQGPHVLADVTLDKVVAKRKEAGVQAVKDILGTGFAPHPDVVNKMLAAETALANVSGKHDFTEKHRDDYFAKYTKKYNKALATDVGDEASVRRRVRTLMNMQPTATYAWGLGRATHDEMAGKGESGAAALADMDTISKNPGVDLKTAGLKTVDFGFETHFPSPLRKAAMRNVEDLGTIHTGGAPRALKWEDIE